MTVNPKNIWQLTFLYWLPLAITIFIMAGLVYAAVQQDYRQGANDPQIQIAEDVANAVDTGKVAPEDIAPQPPTQEMSQSLYQFVIVYSATGTPIGSTVALDGKLPTLPAGVSQYMDKHDQDRITWEPSKGLRIAAVISKFGGANPGFVLAGRSLREVEIRENKLEIMCGVAGLLAWIISFILVFCLMTMHERHHHAHSHEGDSSEHQHAA